VCYSDINKCICIPCAVIQCSAIVAALIVIPFGVVGLVGPWNHVLDGSQDPLMEGAFWGIVLPID